MSVKRHKLLMNIYEKKIETGIQIIKYRIGWLL